jgi:hypothetical protein
MRGFGKVHRSIGLSLWIIYCEGRLPEEGGRRYWWPYDAATPSEAIFFDG